jgi:ATP-binding cassette, subfamily C, bacterial CydCD
MSAPGPDAGVDRRLMAEVGAARRALVGSVALGLLATAAVVAQMLFLARLLAWAYRPAHGAGAPAALVGFLVALVVVVVVAVAAEAWGAHSAAAVTTELRRRLLDHVVDAGPDALGGTRRGALVLSATRGLRSLEGYYARYLPAAVLGALAPPAALIVLGLVDWPSALLALGLVLVVPVAMVRLGRRAAAEADRQWRRLSSMSARYLELLRSIPTLRALGATERGAREVTAANESLAASVDATLRAAMLSGAALEFLAGVGVGLVAMLAGFRLLHGGISVAGALAAILLAPEVFLPLRRAGAEFHAAAEGRSAGAGVLGELAAAPAARTSGHDVPAGPPTLEVVGLSVERGGRQILDALSLRLGPTGHLVVRGPSGTGKSTLLLALGGLVAPDEGRVVVGGADLAAVDEGRRRSLLSIVPQRPHVFAASLGENLSCFGPLDDARARAALELVGLAHLMGPDGLETHLAESGRSMSGGERQRLGLARAYLEDRPIVLLDEPTAHLDDLGIERLRDALGGWLAERLVVEATHDPGLLADAEVLELGALR